MFKFVSSAVKARCETLLVWERGMPWLKTSGTHFYAQLGLIEKKVLQGLDVSDFWSAKRYGPTLLTTVP